MRRFCFSVQNDLEMVLIDAVYINNGGGRVLLEYLIIRILENNVNAFFLLDNRLDMSEYPQNSILLPPSYKARHEFYKKNGERFSKVFCLGNLPPSIRLKAQVFTYFHTRIYIKIPIEYSLIDKLKFSIKQFVVRTIKNNSDYWIVQSDDMKLEFSKKYKTELAKILILPFFPPLPKPLIDVERERGTFIFVSNSNIHKNHLNLIDAFCLFYDEYHYGKLILTVNDDFPAVLDMINMRVNAGYPILNMGFVSREQLSGLYKRSEFLIFPSKCESFGLGLVEAIENGCKVLASDLPYTYEVCKPSAIFNPYDVESIRLTFVDAKNMNLPDSESLVKNKIAEILILIS